MSLKTMLKVCSAAALVLLIFAALGSEKWIPRSGFGWRVDHFFGYFALTLMFSFIWRRPFLFGGALMVLAMLLEGLQAFTPDRHADVYAAMISASGAMTAILPANFLIRAPRLALMRLASMRLLTGSRLVALKWPALAGLAGQPAIAVRLKARLADLSFTTVASLLRTLI
jgi:VanZ family protein